MKKHVVFLAIILAMTAAGCKKHHKPRTPAPHWTTDQTGKYPASMTAVLQVPEDLKPYTQKTDEIGAFIGDECRGTGKLVAVGDQRVFFVLIHGTSSEQSKISFKYWNAWRARIYETGASLDFTVDGNYGTADRPEVLELMPAKR